ncbi:MAG: hypothetical protein ACLQGJ_07660 [Candidatus Dormibacteria bacterium]
MATAAPFVKLLRQLATAKDDYRTGALDISWDGGTASLFLVFGQPNHVVMETAGGERLEGMEALAALVRRLPPKFDLSPWRKEVVRTETLACTLEELMEPFVQLAGAASPGRLPPPGSESAEAGPAGPAIQPDFGLADFPLLPLGPSLWADAAAGVVHLDSLIPSLPDALVVLTGPKLRAAAVVVGQQIVDAVWVDAEDRTVGETAAMALLGAREGSISGYRLEEPNLGEALTMLWRCPAAYREMPTAWINADSLLADLEGGRRNAAIVVTGGAKGVALVTDGALIGVYTESERQPLPSPERLADLLRAPGARITLRQRPEERAIDHLPETAYHAFVDTPDNPPTPLSEAVATLSASGPEGAALDPAASGAGTVPTAAEAIPAPAEPAAEEWLLPEELVPAASAQPAAEEWLPPEELVPAASAEPAAEGWLLPEELVPAASAEPAPGLGELAEEPEWPSSPLAGPEPAADAPVAQAESVTPTAPLAEQPAPLAAQPDQQAAEPVQPVAEGPLGPARFSDFMASQGLGDLAGPELGPNFEAVKADLIQIGALWLGTDGVAPIAQMIAQTRPSISALMATIDAIKSVELPGQEPSVVQAMAREMHYHAAEYLSGL